MWREFQKNVKCHSQAISYRTKWDGIALHVQCTHILIVIGKMWGVRQICATVSPTFCSEGTRRDETAFHKIECHLHFAVQSTRCDEIIIQKVDHCYSHTVSYRNHVRGFFKFDEYGSPFVGPNRARCCDETIIHKMWAITHWLLVIGLNVMRCLSEKWEHDTHSVGHRTRCDETTFQKNGEHDSHPVGYRTRCDETASQKSVEHDSLPVGHTTQCD